MLLCVLLCSCGGINFKELPAVTGDLDISQSIYSHITNGGKYAAGTAEGNEGLPYDIDAITGATLTIEGPAMKESVPFAVGTMESYGKIIVRGQYQDKAGVRTYEGVDLWSLLNDLQADENIIMGPTAYKVIIKDSNRSDVAGFTLDELKDAHDSGRPVILAYGVGTKDGSKAAPFVFNGKTKNEHSLGYESSLKNDDGCLRLVYDLNKYGDAKTDVFANAAYVYVVEENEPGFSHTGSSSEIYSADKLKNYVVSFRGQTLGYELVYTTEQLESLVTHDANGSVAEGGIGYRDAYSLANNTYWYVNEYEGLKLYELLQYLGMPTAEELGSKKAKTTLVSFNASDGVTSSEKFSVEALSYPENFGFYNKNAADNNDGTYVSTNEDLIKLGYPVLLAYGFNNYSYVINKTDEGFLSGLGNSGGPFRVIFGKSSYNHANGSNQVQYLCDVIVGGDIEYNTHIYTDDEDLNAIAGNEFPVSLVTADGYRTSLENFTIGSLEDLLYGRKVTAKAKKTAMVKALFGDSIYEGVDLAYIVSNTLDVPYSDDPSVVNGTVIIKSADGEISAELSDIKAGNYVLAFAKNGTPLVENAGSAGYIEERALNPISGKEPGTYKVDNAGGPICLIMTAEDGSIKFEYDIKSVELKLGMDMAELSSLRTKLAAEKEALANTPPNPDKAWNHSMSPEYSRFLSNTFDVVIQNDTGEYAKTLTIEELESISDAVVRKKYAVMEIGWCEGLDLWKVVKYACRDNADVLNALPDAESVKVVASDAYEIDLKSIFLNDGLENGIKNEDGEMMPIILAYGVKGFPNVSRPTDDGYDDNADNTYGPLRVITETSSQSSMKYCIKVVVKIPGSGDIEL